jgi:cyclopropane-fatty-acyl-phospholipid synthase
MEQQAFGKTMSDIASELEQAGIYPYGSSALQLHESRINRYFTREYEALQKAGHTLESLGIATDEGPMWCETESLMDEHYDARLELLRGFLDNEFMAYTMAQFGEAPEQVLQSPLSLEEAQRLKFKTICERANLKGDEKIFNIGCGFAPLETYLFQNHAEIDITSITPSTTQVSYINACRENPSHPLSQGRLRLIQGSFGEVPLAELGEAAYDIVFAVGAFEHINNLDLAFERISQLLKPGGKCYLHLIVSRIVIPQFLNANKTMIGKYFPGGKIWPYDIIAGQNSHLALTQRWFFNGMNYWRTLEEWHRLYWKNMDNLYGPIIRSHEEARHWNDYFSLSKACFAPFDGALFGNGQFLFHKR